MSPVTPEDEDFIAREAQRFIERVPHLVRPLVPSLYTLLGWVPSRLHQYTVRELMEAFRKLAREGRIPARMPILGGGSR